ncbi:hypothetical protein BY996DRAFT_6491862 [Phakopsora pachyrhizi]|uniref:Secreted protein n=1 Tax=Phakopsora pachyrhizi TaxID=170000 RepID=A0AAV0BRH2_PHAPC|nr:hypothetical protein BY996DRAFT_6491862 [Phakopsora pachyrhizi]CAH7688810.1 hypothetical protein PPACK8108_LOCUS23840 [Phakopsora pachyrhizi]
MRLDLMHVSVAFWMTMMLVSVAALSDRRYDVVYDVVDGHIFEEVVGLVWMNEKAKEMKEMAERSSNLGYGTIIN